MSKVPRVIRILFFDCALFLKNTGVNFITHLDTKVVVLAFMIFFSAFTTSIIAQPPYPSYRFGAITYRRIDRQFPIDVPTPGMTVVIRIYKYYGTFPDPPPVLIGELATVSDANSYATMDVPCFPSIGQDQFSTVYDSVAVNADGTYSATGSFFNTQFCNAYGTWGGSVYSFNPLIGNSPDFGPTGPNQSVGCPVNTATGNMWLEQSDYQLPSVVESITIQRTYNSMNQSNGLFGLGWTSNYDVALLNPNQSYVQLKLPDGQSVLFRRENNQYFSTNPHFHGSLVKNADNTLRVTLKDGRTYHFGATGRFDAVLDRNGNQTTLNYNVNGVLIGVTDQFNRTLTVSLNGNGFVSQISDTIGFVASYQYDDNMPNVLKTITYNDGSKYQFEYTTISGKTYLTTVKDALDNVLETHAYDSSGRATTSERHGGQERFVLDYSNWNTSVPFTQITDALGRVTKYYFAPSGSKRLVTKTEGLCSCGGSGSEVVQYFYDLSGNLTKKIDALSREIIYTYDSNGNRLTMTDVLGTETFTYNSFGQFLTQIDRMGGVTTNTYNATGNLLTAKDALNNTTTLTYTTLGQPATIKDARNNTTTLTWDTQGRMTKVKDANNKETNFAYDARARVTSVTNTLSQTTNVEYDLNNRLKKIIYPDTTFTQMTYDLAGRRTGVTDPLGHATTYAYDAAYRLHRSRLRDDAGSNRRKKHPPQDLPLVRWMHILQRKFL